LVMISEKAPKKLFREVKFFKASTKKKAFPVNRKTFSKISENLSVKSYLPTSLKRPFSASVPFTFDPGVATSKG
jgi:hypothetical protein